MTVADKSSSKHHIHCEQSQNLRTPYCPNATTWSTWNFRSARAYSAETRRLWTRGRDNDAGSPLKRESELRLDTKQTSSLQQSRGSILCGFCSCGSVHVHAVLSKFRRWNSDYFDLLLLFRIPTLGDHRLYLSLCSMYKIVHKLIDFPQDVFIPKLSTRLQSSSLTSTFVQPFSRTNSLKFSLIPHTC